MNISTNRALKCIGDGKFLLNIFFQNLFYLKISIVGRSRQLCRAERILII